MAGVSAPWVPPWSVPPRFIDLCKLGYTRTPAAAGTITKAAGWRGLFTGYAPTLLEDIPDMAVKLRADETLRTMHRSFVNKDDDEADALHISHGFDRWFSRGCRDNAFDVVKTRMMCNAAARPSFGGAIVGDERWHIWLDQG